MDREVRVKKQRYSTGWVIYMALIFGMVDFMCASAPAWSWEKSLWLEKEQLYKARFSVGNVEKDFQFRWTLYKNHGLVLHIRYDKFNHQEVLYTDYQRSSFKIPLGMGQELHKDNPNLLLYFKEFAEKKAAFKLYIEGKGASLESEEIEPIKPKASIADIDRALGKNTNQNTSEQETFQAKDAQSNGQDPNMQGGNP